MIPGEGKCQGLEDETQERLVLPVFTLLLFFKHISLETLVLGHIKVKTVSNGTHFAPQSYSLLFCFSLMYCLIVFSVWILHHSLIKYCCIFYGAFEKLWLVVLLWRIVKTMTTDLSWFNLWLYQRPSEVRSWKLFLLLSMRKKKKVSCLWSI